MAPPAGPPEGLPLRRDQPAGGRQLAMPRLLLLILCSIVVTVGLLLGASLAMAQVPPLVGRGPYEPDRVGIPMGPQVIDVRWSGDRMGEFTEIGVLPPAFRGPAPVGFGPVVVPPPGPVPAPVPGPLPPLVPGPVPSPVPSPVRVPTILLPNR